MADEVNIIISATDKASGILKGIGSAAGSILKAGALAAAGGITALGGAIGGALIATNKWAETVDSVGDILGTTSEQSSALAVAAQSIGAPVEQITNSIAVMTRGLFDAKGEIGPTGKVLQDLGVAFQDANGKILPANDILQQVADKLAAMPEGLEKTQLQMDLFGKSGKDVGDLMNVLANGGMAAMDEKAKAMGLSMSGPATEGAIKMGRSMNDLKLMGQGLLVTLGSELLPILQPLIEQFMKAAMEALPAVKQAISDAIPVIKDIFQWIGDNLIPVIQELVAWMVEYIPPAVEKAVTWFEENLLPAIKEIWAFVKDPLLPILGDIITWLATNLWTAITQAVGFIKNTLLPALADIWLYVNDNLLPKLAEIIKWLEETIKTAIDIFKGIWSGISEAFTTVYNFVTNDLLGPEGVFTKIVDFLKNGWAGVKEAVAGVWNGIMGAIQPIIDALKWIIDNARQALELLGLVKSSGGGSDMSNSKPPANPGGGGGPGGDNRNQTFAGGEGLGATVINNWNLTIYAQDVVDPIQSFQMMQALARA